MIIGVSRKVMHKLVSLPQSEEHFCQTEGPWADPSQWCMSMLKNNFELNPPTKGKQGTLYFLLDVPRKCHLYLLTWTLWWFCQPHCALVML